MTSGTDGFSGPPAPQGSSARGPASLASAFGTWLMPVTAFRPRSEQEHRIRLRAGAVGIACLATGFLAMAAAALWIALNAEWLADTQQATAPLILTGALLVALGVFSPRPVFRTRSAAVTRSVLSNPSAPLQTWRSSTLTFNMVLVGALVAGLYYNAAIMTLLFCIAFGLRTIVLSRTQAERDPNARYHALVASWASALTAAVAFAIVAPLASIVAWDDSIIPVLLGALVAMYVGLGVSSLDRWVNAERGQWGLLRDALDTRRIVVAAMSAAIAWVVAVVGHAVAMQFPANPTLAGALTGMGVFLVALLVLWFVSIRMWVHESMRTLAVWSAHQAEVIARIADGSLSPELAARAAVPLTARMAVSVFGATRAMVVIDDGRGHVVTHLAAADAYPHGRKAEARDLADAGSLRMPLYPIPGHPNGSSVTVGHWLWAGWFMTRSKRIVGTFTDLATSALLSPVIASFDDRDTAAYDVMFDRIHRWPTLPAFHQAVERMQARADANPHSDSLLIGVYAIDEFGALAGGRFEHAAVAQVMRLALGYQQFAGHDLFAAYEEPGRLWLALGGGPIIRNSIGDLRGLQEHINDHGSVPSARLDVDVHVSVSFGYAAHQVDEFTREGLMAAALQRLGVDQGARDPFNVESLISYDIRPEDIVGQLDAPVTAVNTLQLLVTDRDQPEAFVTRFAPLLDASTGDLGALVVSVGWQRTFGSLDLSDPNAFLALVGRQPQVAAEAARICLARLKQAFVDIDELGMRELPLVISLPSILLHPDAAELALPNLVTPFLDRRECARTVVLVDSVPTGSGQALRLLSDRGVHIAVSAAAAAGAEQADLFGWLRWAIVFPPHVLQAPSGIDGMTVQQTTSAIATRDTRLVGVADANIDHRELAAHNIGWLVTMGEYWSSAQESAVTPRTS